MVMHHVPPDAVFSMCSVLVLSHPDVAQQFPHLAVKPLPDVVDIRPHMRRLPRHSGAVSRGDHHWPELPPLKLHQVQFRGNANILLQAREASFFFADQKSFTKGLLSC